MIKKLYCFVPLVYLDSDWFHPARVESGTGILKP